MYLRDKTKLLHVIRDRAYHQVAECQHYIEYFAPALVAVEHSCVG